MLLLRLCILATAAFTLLGQIREHKSPGTELPHDRFIQVVSPKRSPAQQVYIKSKDGLYVASVIRKPRGKGPFPAVIYFHGAPGGRGMEKLTEWSLGKTGSPVWERLLKEGYIVVVADYRNNASRTDDLIQGERVSYVDDGAAVLDYVSKLPYVKPDRIALYGVSRGGNLVMHLISRMKVAAAVLGAPAVAGYFNFTPPQGPNRFDNPKLDVDYARRQIQNVQNPVLILIGTKDPLITLAHPLYYTLAQNGKRVQMEIYENGYHDFCIGPQGNQGYHQPLLDSTLDALEKTIEFLAKYLKN